jgi:alkyl hydroperoxide reductase 1
MCYILISPPDRYIPYAEEQGDITACGIPINYNASKEWADKKVVLFSVPGQCLSNTSPSLYNRPQGLTFFSLSIGAFTPACSLNHLPGYIQNLPKLKEKGVDVVAVIAFNDPFVMSAWGKANEIKNDSIVRSPCSNYHMFI